MIRLINHWWKGWWVSPSTPDGQKWYDRRVFAFDGVCESRELLFTWRTDVKMVAWRVYGSKSAKKVSKKRRIDIRNGKTTYGAPVASLNPGLLWVTNMKSEGEPEKKEDRAGRHLNKVSSCLGQRDKVEKIGTWFGYREELNSKTDCNQSWRRQFLRVGNWLQ